VVKTTKAKKPSGTTKPKPKTLVEDAVVVKETPKVDTKDTKPKTLDAKTKVESKSKDSPVSPKVKKSADTQAKKKTGIILPMLFGGIIFGAAGFGAATYYFMNQPTVDSAEISQVQTGISENTAMLKETNATLTGLIQSVDAVKADDKDAVAIAGLATVSEDNKSELNNKITEVSMVITDLQARLTTVEKRPIAESGGMTAEAAKAYERELEDMRKLLETQRTEIQKLADETTSRIKEAAQQAETLEQSANETANNAAKKVALSQIAASLDNGVAFESALLNLKAAGVTDIPDALMQAATTGVPTVATLKADFPAAARVALAASIKETSGDSISDKLGSFFQSQVGGRSIEPREGDDPDAVLSRAEAAIKVGDIEKALSLVDMLPEAGKAAMQDWATAANLRKNSGSAVLDLTNSLNGN